MSSITDIFSKVQDGRSPPQGAHQRLVTHGWVWYPKSLYYTKALGYGGDIYLMPVDKPSPTNLERWWRTSAWFCSIAISRLEEQIALFDNISQAAHCLTRHK